MPRRRQEGADFGCVALQFPLSHKQALVPTCCAELSGNLKLKWLYFIITPFEFMVNSNWIVVNQAFRGWWLFSTLLKVACVAQSNTMDYGQSPEDPSLEPSDAPEHAILLHVAEPLGRGGRS